MTKEEMIKSLEEVKKGVVDYRDGEKLQSVIDALNTAWVSEEHTDGYPEEIDVPVLIEYSGRTVNITYDHALTIARWFDDDCGSKWFFDDLDVTEDGIEDLKVHRWWYIPEEQKTVMEQIQTMTLPELILLFIKIESAVEKGDYGIRKITGNRTIKTWLTSKERLDI